MAQKFEVGQKVVDQDGDEATVTAIDRLGRYEIEYPNGEIGVVYSDEIKAKN